MKQHEGPYSYGAVATAIAMGTEAIDTYEYRKANAYLLKAIAMTKTNEVFQELDERSGKGMLCCCGLPRRHRQRPAGSKRVDRTQAKTKKNARHRKIRRARRQI